MLLEPTMSDVVLFSSYHLGPFSTVAPIYSLLFHVFYRLIMDSAGQADFAKSIPPFGGLGTNYWDVVFSQGVLNVITLVDWCCLLGVQNQDVLCQLLEKLEEQRGSFHDEIIGFFVDVNNKLEEMAKHLLDQSEATTHRKDYVLFVQDIILSCSTFIRCIPKVSSFCGFSVGGLLHV